MASVPGLAATSLLVLGLGTLGQASTPDPVPATGAFLGAAETTYPAWFKDSFLELADDVAEAADEGRRVIILFHQDGCPACEQWSKEVGEIYPLTDEAKILPLRKFDIYQTLPEDLSFLGRVRFTPYFAVVHDGSKVGEIIGYVSEDFFYYHLGELIEKLKVQRGS